MDMHNVSIESIQHRNKPGVAFWQITFRGDLAKEHIKQTNARMPPRMQLELSNESYEAWKTLEETKACVERVIGRSVSDEEIASAVEWNDE